MWERAPGSRSTADTPRAPPGPRPHKARPRSRTRSSDLESARVAIGLPNALDPFSGPYPLEPIRRSAPFQKEAPVVLRVPGPPRKLQRLPELMAAALDTHQPQVPTEGGKRSSLRSEARAGKEYLSSWKTNLGLSNDKSWLLYPARARNRGDDAFVRPPPSPPTLLDRLRHSTGLCEEDIIGLLRKHPLFHALPDGGLRTICQRGRHRAVARYATVIREGTVCPALHILLHGQLHSVSASKTTSVAHNAGSYFGEDALITQVQQYMDTTVKATEDSYLLQLTHADLRGLRVDLSEIRKRVVKTLLGKIRSFNLTRMQLDRLAALLDIECRSRGEHIYREGDMGSALYVLTSGRVELYQRSEPTKGRSESGELPVDASCTAASLRPWFGELALWADEPRVQTAICTEPTTLLVLQRPQYRMLLEVAPSFQDKLKSSILNTMTTRPDGTESQRTTAMVGHWERFTMALFEKQRQQEEDDFLAQADRW